jgi:hypothetical protein
MCGAIRYRIAGAPEFVVQCYCRDCQLATGTGHTTIVGVKESNLGIDGTPRRYTNSGDTGGRVNRHFCSTCGSRLYTSGDLPGEIRMVQAGTLDDPNSVSPTAAIYLKSRIHWDVVSASLSGFDAMIPHEPR